METKIYWNGISDNYYKNDDSIVEIIKKNPEKGFPPDVYEMIKKEFSDFKNVNVLVPSSGDNIAAFSFYLLGANVTSSDLSDKQIGNARKIAEKNNWNIEFACCDSMTLEGIKEDKFDLVYTSNGVHIWIKDLITMYKNIYRVLKNSGYYIFFETHPIIRPFDDSGNEIKIIKPYELIGPFHYEDCGDEYKWRIEDIIRGLLSADLTIKDYRDIKARPTDIMSHNWFYHSKKELEKDNAQKFDWLKNPWAALPQWISIKVKK